MKEDGVSERERVIRDIGIGKATRTVDRHESGRVRGNVYREEKRKWSHVEHRQAGRVESTTRTVRRALWAYRLFGEFLVDVPGSWLTRGIGYKPTRPPDWSILSATPAHATLSRNYLSLPISFSLSLHPISIFPSLSSSTPWPVSITSPTLDLSPLSLPLFAHAFNCLHDESLSLSLPFSLSHSIFLTPRVSLAFSTLPRSLSLHEPSTRTH